MPYILVVGDKEKQNGTVAVRGLGGLDLGAIAFDDFVARCPRTSPPPRRCSPRQQRCLTFIGTFNIATEKANRINGEIRVPEVRLIGLDGEQLGIVKIADAFRLSEQSDVDLVEIAPNAEPPVCRLMDYGKFKYQEQKRQAEARSKQKVIQVKKSNSVRPPTRATTKSSCATCAASSRKATRPR